jgi:hypothetical protein
MTTGNKMNLPYALTFDKNTDISEIIRPLTPKRFDVTFNKTCLPEPNTICYYAELAPDKSVAEEELVRQELKNSIKDLYDQSIKYFKNSFITNFLDLTYTTSESLIPLTGKDRDDASMRQMNCITLDMSCTKFLVLGHQTVIRDPKTCPPIDIQTAMLLFGAMESLSVVLAKRFRSNSNSMLEPLFSLLKHTADSMLDNVNSLNWCGIQLNLTYFNVEQNAIEFHVNQNLISLILEAKHPIKTQLIRFGFSIVVYSDSLTVTFGNLDDVELYKKCFSLTN